MDELIRRKDALDALALVVKTNSAPYVPQYARQALKNIPAVEASPIVHGQWIPQVTSDGKNYGLKCSECGAWLIMDDQYSYCPSCGAKMDRRTADDTSD